MTTTEIKPFTIVHPDGRMEVNLSEPQSQVWASTALITGMQAGTGSGKTSMLFLWLKREMDERGPGDYLVVCPTFPLMESRVIPELRDLFEHKLHLGQYKPGYHRFDSYERIDGHPAYRVFLGSAANPESLESMTAKACCIDELAQSQFSRQSWEAIRRRCAFFNARILFATTLYDVSSWYTVELYGRWLKKDKNINIIQCDSISNPAYPIEQWNYAKETLPAWKFDLFHRGRLTKPANLIYDTFDPINHVIPWSALRMSDFQTWPRFVGHDFGPSNTAAVWLAQEPGTNILYVYRTYHKGGLSVGQHAEEFRELSKNETIRVRVGGAWGEEEARNAYTYAGWHIMKPSIQNVEVGIDRVYSFMALGKIRVLEDCQEFLDELLTYTRAMDENYENTEVIQNKSRFHLMDSLRYIMTSFDAERAPGARQVAKIKRFP